MKQLALYGFDNDERPAPTLRQAWEMYDGEHLITLRPKTRETVRYRMKSWLEWYGDTRLTDMAHPGSEYRQRRHRMPGTLTNWAIDMEIQAARAVCYYATRMGLVAENPLKNVKLSRLRSRQRKRTYTDKEVAAILRATDWPALRLVILFCRTGGFRPGEVARALMSDFDPTAGSLSVPAERRKNHRDHIGYVSDSAVDEAIRFGPVTRTYLIENPATGKPYAYSWVGRRWREACDAAGIAGGDRVMHALRHTFCSTLFDARATHVEVADAMGITLKQVETYAHPLKPMRSVFAKAHRIGPARKRTTQAKKDLTAGKKLA